MRDGQRIDRTTDERVEASTTSGNPSERPRGRHLAARREYPNRWLAILGILPVILVAVLLVRMLGAKEQPTRPAATTSTLDVLGPLPTPPAGPAAFGNLVRNWSFEQDLSGWEVVGPATASREPQGRTSGSSAAVRPTGSQPQRVGLALPKVVPSVRHGSRYVASAWVRSTPPGLKVTLRLVATGGGGGEGEASQAVTATLPGNQWDRVTVAHQVAAAQASLDLQITAADVEPGEALLIDEVELRRG
jgi:Carbohydrate binding domain